MPRVLIVLPQLPTDPASGAARTVRIIGEMLERSGFTVRGVATTATEHARGIAVAAHLRACGVVPRRSRSARSAELELTYQGVPYTLVAGGTSSAELDRAFERVLDAFAPHVLFTYGGTAADVRRQRAAKARGCRVVLGLYNTDYRTREFFAHVDAVLTPSEFLSSLYRVRCGIESTPIPTPIDAAETIAIRRRPTCVTMINPSIGKGVMFFARLADELGRRRPAIPLLVVESRGDASLLLQAGFAGGLDLRRYESLRIVRSVPFPKRIYGRTRVLLVPSAAEEASGRVVAEALLNGIPPIVSERGGLPENCGTGGFVLPLPATLTVDTRRPVGADEVTGWRELVVRLVDDERFYRDACARALAFSARYDPASVRAAYGAFFERVAARRPGRSAAP